VLIDEFQDTNTIQLELMKLLASKNGRVTIVGDPDQSIYGFRAAEIQNLTRMQQHYPSTSIIHLEENYRSSAAVLRCAQEVIEQDQTRPDKRLKATHCYGTFPVLRRLPSAHDEAKWTVSEIRRLKAMTGNLTTFSDYAILLRSAHLSRLLENSLGKAGVPYRMVGGYRFFDREEIRTLLDYLRTISQPNNNVALSAIINVPSRKIGDESSKELLRMADEKGISLWAVVQKISKGDLAMKKKLSMPAEQKLCKLISLIKEAKKRMSTVSVESTAKFLLDFCIKQLTYKEFLQSKHPEDHESRWANVEELLNQAADIAESESNAGGADLGESLPEVKGVEKQQLNGNDEALASFLANITLSSDLQASEDGQEQDCITISTIHSAKGLEWPIVFIPALYDGSIPHSRAEDTDEERRLLYVAMTRAKALLYLTHPLRQSRSGTETTLSSFLPNKLHRHLVKIGPEITDKVVKDIALILRRSPPSEEELVKGLKSLSERESSQDNLWPDDGSAKPRQWWDFDNEAISTRKTFRADTVRNDGLQIHQNQNNRSRAHGMNVETTITSSNSFTVASASVAFSTAAQHHELSRSRQLKDEPESESRDEPAGNRTVFSNSKKRKGKSAAGQGSLVNFFARGTFGSTVEPHAPGSMPEPELPKYIDTYARPATQNIPVAFTSHKVSTKPASLKRPRPLEETPSAKRNEHVFLSSSPTRESNMGRSSEAFRDGDAKVVTEQERILTSSFKSVTTMHTTSMDILQQQKHIGARRTYGVRRMMDGWENRKNR
jgi:DNA helicase II / ATP-dependent DNA helicase PcrA